MSDYFLMIFIIGLIALSMYWVPSFCNKIGISYSIFYLVIGVGLYVVLPGVLPLPDPRSNQDFALHASEIIVIISLMGTGIKIDRMFSFKTWQSPLRLVSVAMILTILFLALSGRYILGFDLSSAVLLGAVLAPTDPVLADDVQVEKPNQKETTESKFALTAEAGMNDGMAFPFTWLAIVLAKIAHGMSENITTWFGVFFMYKILMGVGIGFLFGKLIGYLIFTVSRKYKFFKDNNGFLAISLTLAVYGITEILSGYGFIAVFVSAITLRATEKNHAYHRNLHSFTEQIEKLMVAILIVLFGGSLITGILNGLTWSMVGVALLLLLVIRPISAYISLVGFKANHSEKMIISFFGIRGMGSIFYLAFAFSMVKFEYEKELWTTVAFTILLSIVIHGLTATRAMSYLERRNKKGPSIS